MSKGLNSEFVKGLVVQPGCGGWMGSSTNIPAHTCPNVDDKCAYIQATTTRESREKIGVQNPKKCEFINLEQMSEKTIFSVPGDQGLIQIDGQF